MACLPIKLLVYGLEFQGKAAAAYNYTSKKPERNTKGIIYAAMVETYALLGFVTSMLSIRCKVLKLI